MHRFDKSKKVPEKALFLYVQEVTCVKKFMRIYFTLVSMLPMISSCAYAASSVDQLKGKLPVIINGIAWIGYGISFGMLIFIGIKYMLSAANEKATLKQGAINYVIGGALIACASFVADIVASVASQGTASDAGGFASQLISTAQQAAGFTGP
jgi:hypothetical protein